MLSHLIKQHRRAFPSSLLWELGSIRIHVRQKSSGGRRPKKKIYHRVHELDRVMELRKKPALILQLKSIIQSQRHQSLLLRDLEKHVGFVQKWDFMSVIEKYPSIFKVSGGGGGSSPPPSVSFTHNAEKLVREEAQVTEAMEPIVVKNLRKLLMLSVDCRIPLPKIELIESQLPLPRDFKDTFIPKYPEFFSLRNVNGRDYLQLEHWDSGLAVTAREEWLAQEGTLVVQSGGTKKARISKDGNYLGPFAFRMKYPDGFRPNTSYLKEIERWQRMDFPSPYLNARQFGGADPKARKRVVGVIHELLSLMVEKRMTCAQIDALAPELHLPSRLVLFLIKHQGIFYITNKGERGTVFLKDAYDGSSNLIDKCPFVLFNDKFVELSGRRCSSVCSQVAPPHVVTSSETTWKEIRRWLSSLSIKRKIHVLTTCEVCNQDATQSASPVGEKNKDKHDGKEQRQNKHHYKDSKRKKHLSPELAESTDASEETGKERRNRSQESSNHKGRRRAASDSEDDVGDRETRRSMILPENIKHKAFMISEEERVVKLRKMQMDAELHEEQRWKRSKRAYDNDAQEAKQDISSRGKSFWCYVQKSVYGAEKGGSSTIEERVSRRTYYPQHRSQTGKGNAFRLSLSGKVGLSLR